LYFTFLKLYSIKPEVTAVIFLHMTFEPQTTDRFVILGLNSTIKDDFERYTNPDENVPYPTFERAKKDFLALSKGVWDEVKVTEQLSAANSLIASLTDAFHDYLIGSTSVSTTGTIAPANRNLDPCTLSPAEVLQLDSEEAALVNSTIIIPPQELAGMLSSDLIQRHHIALETIWCKAENPLQAISAYNLTITLQSALVDHMSSVLY